jgi:TAT (twin-arginine translocation) pathway signal sequence
MANAILPFCSPPSQPTRRTVLAGLAAAGAAAAIAGEVDPHPAWWREAVELREWLDAPEQEEIEDHARTTPFARMCDLHDLIATTPARTAAGAAVQLAYVVYLIEHSISEQREFDAIASARAVLEQLAGGQAHV